MRTLKLLLLIGTLISTGEAWHGTDNVDYDCWPDDESALNKEGAIPCPGIGLQWVEEPPNSVAIGVDFSVSYRVVTRDSNFYAQHYNNIYFNFASSDDFRTLCESMSCPDATSAASNDCCVHHSNVHSCAPSISFCGPWILSNGTLSTHTASQAGLLNRTWMTHTRLNYLGSNFLLAHVKIRKLHIALGKEILVTEEPRDDVPLATVVPAVVIPMVIIPLVIVAIVVGSVYGWYHYQRKKLLYDESWIIDFDKIEREVGYRGFMGSLVSMRWMESDAGGLSNGDGYISNVQRKQVFTQTGMFGGRTVAIKKVSRNSFSLTQQVREDVRQMRVLDHPNLCKFVGASLKVPNVAIITEYCPKGSLNDVLLNDDIPLNWSFRFSFVADIARAMSYLHTHRVYHGRLKSSNCIIDDRWVVKVTDYGLTSFRCSERKCSDPSYSQKQEGIPTPSNATIYLAPERRGDFESTPTAASDVYSFAIILVEIGSRLDPYSDEVELDGSGRPTLPNFKEQECPCSHEYQDLICRCWSHSPLGRPSFDQLRRSIQQMNPNKESPVDMMMSMMEKYSKHLEVLVAERTQELIAEQKKTDSLLYSMLPQPVADSLRQGKPANAQSYQCATIFFRLVYDIIGFTTLAHSSTPLQVVKLLNELYTMFDTITDTFDVYKVETIGDAYMVVSGVPKENGLSHVSEIANMALDLVASCKKFRIPHRQDQTLQIRAGIHSGPVVAGVVGSKMPRFCLFGDTVNTASRMESSSEAMKIQASDSSAQLLRKVGGFTLDCRGTVQVKGKGSMMTWWLTGRESLLERASTPVKRISVSAMQSRSSSEHSGTRSATPSGSKTNFKPPVVRIDTQMSLPGVVEDSTVL